MTGASPRRATSGAFGFSFGWRWGHNWRTFGCCDDGLGDEASFMMQPSYACHHCPLSLRPAAVSHFIYCTINAAYLDFCWLDAKIIGRHNNASNKKCAVCWSVQGWLGRLGSFRSPVSVCVVHVMSGRPQVLVLDARGSTSWKIAFEHLLEAHSETKKTQLKLKCEGVFL